MVAASGETEGLRPIVAWVLLAAVLVLVIAAAVWSGKTKLYRRVPLEIPPDALAQRARDILQSIGYSEPPVDTAMGFYSREKIFCDISRSTTNRKRVGTISIPERLCFGIAAARNRSRLFVPSLPAPVQGSVWTDDPPLDACPG